MADRSKIEWTDASWLHFDIAKSKRRLAVQAGAVETDKYGPVEFLASRSGDHTKIDQVARCRALKETA